MKSRPQSIKSLENKGKTDLLSEKIVPILAKHLGSVKGIPGGSLCEPQSR
jgi:hypothetical protein